MVPLQDLAPDCAGQVRKNVHWAPQIELFFAENYRHLRESSSIYDSLSTFFCDVWQLFQLLSSRTWHCTEIYTEIMRFSMIAFWPLKATPKQWPALRQFPNFLTKLKQTRRTSAQTIVDLNNCPGLLTMQARLIQSGRLVTQLKLRASNSILIIMLAGIIWIIYAEGNWTPQSKLLCHAQRYRKSFCFVLALFVCAVCLAT